MRFRPKTDFLTFARDQIRGGIWYKPAWWEAVRKVPPTAFFPRIKKQHIPTLQFIEDRLISDFRAKNPGVAQFDKLLTGQYDPRTVGQLFAAKQLEYMRADKSEAEAYQHARIWLLDNGHEILERLGIELDDPDPDARRRLLQAHADALAEQEARMRRVFGNLTIGDPEMPQSVLRAVTGRAAGGEVKLGLTAGVEPPEYVPEDENSEP